MTTEKFGHLDKMDPDVRSILNIPIEFIKDSHLSTLRTNLSRFSVSNNLDLANAATSIIARIDSILELGKSKITGEIMSSVASPHYNKNILH